MAEDNYRGAEQVFGWSFYSQGTEGAGDLGRRVHRQGARVVRRSRPPARASAWDRGRTPGRPDPAASARSCCSMAWSPCRSGQAFDRGKLKDPGARSPARSSWRSENPGLCVITTREPVADLADDEIKATVRRARPGPDLDRRRSRPAASHRGSRATREELRSSRRGVRQPCLAIKLLGTWIGRGIDCHIGRAATIPDLDIPASRAAIPVG